MRNKFHVICFMAVVAILLMLSVFAIPKIAIKIVSQGKGEVFIAGQPN